MHQCNPDFAQPMTAECFALSFKLLAHEVFVVRHVDSHGLVAGVDVSTTTGSTHARCSLRRVHEAVKWSTKYQSSATPL